MKKVGYFFLCFLPMIAAICLQFVVTFPMMGVSTIQVCFSNIFSGKKAGYNELTTQLMNAWSNENFMMLISVAFAGSCILIFGFWYAKQFDGNFKQSPKSFINPPIIIGLILLVPGLQMLSSVVTGITSSLFPSWMDYYEKLMESAGFSGEPSVLLVLYAVLLGPVGEEMIFRGVTFSSAKKALPFWAANLFQAFLFGVFHLNLIQGIYAFFIGLFLGYVCGKGGSIYLSVFLHILFNAWGTFMPTDSALYKNPMYLGIFFIVSIFLGILGLFLFGKNTLPQKVNHSIEVSDM